MFRQDSKKRDKKPSAVKVKIIPYVPPQVKLENLDPETLRFKQKVVKNKQPEEKRTLTRSMSTEKNKNVPRRPLGRAQSVTGFDKTAISMFSSKKESGAAFSKFFIEGNEYTLNPRAPLGKGIFGKVEVCQSETGEWFAIKKQLPIEDEKHERFTRRSEEESNVLYQAGASPTLSPLFRESLSKRKEQSMILMKLAEGISMQELINEETQNGFQKYFITDPSLSPMLRIYFSIKAIEAVKKLMEEKRLLHRDIKPANFIINSADLDSPVTLIDFGLAKEMDHNNEVKDFRPVGSFSSLAPEIREELLKLYQLENYEPEIIYNEKTEVYALGISLAHLFGFFADDEAPDSREVIEWIQEEAQNEIDEWKESNYLIKTEDDRFLYSETIPMVDQTIPEQREKLLMLFYRMTALNPKERCSMDEALQVLAQIQVELKNQPLKIAVIDIKEYVESDPEQRIALLNELRLADQVMLVDTEKNRKDIDYIGIKRELELEFSKQMEVSSKIKNLVVKNAVLVGENKNEIDEVLSAYLKKQPLPARQQWIEVKPKQRYTPNQ